VVDILINALLLSLWRIIIENITRTVGGAYLQTCMLMGLPFSVKTSTTLNEKLSIQSGVVPDTGVYPTMRYYAIGIGGHTFTTGAGGRTKPEIVQHLGTDFSLYNQIPFVMREVNNDLSITERAKYAHRRQETHGGTDWFAYYLKRIDFTGTVAGMELTTVRDGVTTVTAFVPDSSNLNPTPPDLSSTGVNLVSGDYVSATAKVTLVLTPDEVTEILNVAQVLFDDPEFAVISEIALCSGVDKQATSPAQNGGIININEAIAVQVVSFINTFQPLAFSNNGTELDLDIGSSEPLFLLE
jgi:hypothetical protein